MVSLCFLNPDNAPTDEAKNALPSDLGPPPAEVIEKTVVLFHDETTFQANEDQRTFWLRRGQVLCIRSQGAVGSWLEPWIHDVPSADTRRIR